MREADRTTIPSIAGTSNEGDEPTALTGSENSTLSERRPQFSHLVASMSEFWLQQENKVNTIKKNSEEGATTATDESKDQNPTMITSESDLNLPNRHFHIVTTAALPWFTGTAVNPLLRAAYLHRRTQEINRRSDDEPKQQWVTLVIPWLDQPKDQKETLGLVFTSQQEQEYYIREWLRNDAGMPDVASDLRILFYEARYHSRLGSIFAMGDLLQTMEATGLTMDVCVLEEPEHVNWFRAPGDGWTQKYKFVIGVLHTNYKEYVMGNGGISGLWAGPAISFLSSAMVRAYCHKVIKLSSALHDYAPEKEVVCNVHGVRSEFLKKGRRRATECPSAQDETTPYFIGKLLWAKGLDLLLRLEDYHKALTGEYFPVDIYGKGPEQGIIQKAFQTGSRNQKEHRQTNGTAMESIIGKTVDIVFTKDENDDSNEMEARSCTAGMLSDISISTCKTSSKSKPSSILSSSRGSASSLESMAKSREPVPCHFPGRVDHLALGRYKTFVNPSISEVLCTTTAEALAMGKFVIVPIHPSNEFFLSFPNCLGYRNEFEFVANLHWAQNKEPMPMTSEMENKLTWEAATDRFIDASAITVQEAQKREQSGQIKLDERIAWFHNELGKGRRGDIIRKIFGGGPVSEQAKFVKDAQNQDDTITGRATDSDDSESLSSSESMVGIKEVSRDGIPLPRGDSSSRDNATGDDGWSANVKFRSSGFSDAVRVTLSSFKKTTTKVG